MTIDRVPRNFATSGRFASRAAPREKLAIGNGGSIVDGLIAKLRDEDEGKAIQSR